jgi:PAS domain S-box-containing protein
MRDQARANAEAQARMLLDENLAVHTYFTRQLKPKLFELTGPLTPEGYFDPTWMSSTYAVREIGGYFRELNPFQYYYKECAIDARSPKNEADAYEREFLEQINKDPTLEVRSGVRVLAGETFLSYLRRGETMEASCLRCHSHPGRAPTDLIKAYGPDRSFHRAEGDVVSAVSIRIPLAEAYAKVGQVTRRLSWQFALTLFLASILLFWLLRRLATSPLRLVTAKAMEIAHGPEHLGETIAEPRTREFRELAGAFNAMSLSLRRSHTHLEEQIQERTQVYQQANAELEKEVGERIRGETRYRLLFQSMSNGFALHEVLRDESNAPCDYRFLEVNSAFERLTGLRAEGLLGRTVREVLPDTESYWIERYGRVAETGQSEHFENYSGALDKHYEVTAYSPEPGQFATLFVDVTERKRAQEKRLTLERQIQHTQKLESLGVLAGGIAHDFNNILMAVLGNASMALEGLPPGSPIAGNVQEIEQASRRAADLCRQMLAYAGKGKYVVEKIGLNGLIEEMVGLLKTSTSKKAIMNLNLEKQLPCLEGDATQIRQVLMNLVVNASEAIGERGGVITISTGAMDCMRDYLTEVSVDQHLGEGRYVYLEVSDTGCGMDKETLSRLFEPFFTTKFTGRGLGMAAVQGIVRGHKGALRVYSEVGKGSTFKILFPALAPDTAAGAPPAVEANLAWRGSGRVLLVDDEETIRVLGMRMLEHLGFSVLTAADGHEAIDVFEKGDGQIDLVLLDVTMPHLNGEETFRELRRIDPEVRVVMSSGYTEHDIAGRFAGKRLAGFIQKPYNLGALRECLRALFEGKSGAV